MTSSVTETTHEEPRGRIACVGLGMTLGSHLTPLARSHIRQADVVFAAVSDNVVEMWLERMHHDVRSLQPYYGQGKPRTHTYREWVDVMMREVRAGQRVCAVFYGHPGVFAWSPHKIIEVARSEGFPAQMEPGISAEDCLYVDLAIDPGQFGCQHLEANQLLFYERKIDTSGYLILWQIGMIGNDSIARADQGRGYRELLAETLMEEYPADHEVILYRCATLPIERPRIRRMPLSELPAADIAQEETLVLPPARVLRRNAKLTARLAELDRKYAAPGETVRA